MNFRQHGVILKRFCFQSRLPDVLSPVENDVRPEASPQTTLLISVLSFASGTLLGALIGVLG